MVVGFAAAAIIGGIAGGLIVRATWGSGNGNPTAAAGVAACPAATVADQSLPSVVTVRANTDRGGATGSGVVSPP